MKRFILFFLFVLFSAANAFSQAESVETLLNQGVRLFDQGKYQEALVPFNQCLEQSPNHLECHLNRGVSFDRLGQLDDAFQDYSRAIELNPKIVDAFVARAMIYFRTQRYENALADLSSAIAADPNRSQTYDRRALVFTCLSRPEEAIRDFLTYLNLAGWKTERVLPAALVGYIAYREVGKDREARDLVKTAIANSDSAAPLIVVFRFLNGDLSADELRNTMTDRIISDARLAISYKKFYESNRLQTLLAGDPELLEELQSLVNDTEPDKVAFHLAQKLLPMVKGVVK